MQVLGLRLRIRIRLRIRTSTWYWYWYWYLLSVPTVAELKGTGTYLYFVLCTVRTILGGGADHRHDVPAMYLFIYLFIYLLSVCLPVVSLLDVYL